MVLVKSTIVILICIVYWSYGIHQNEDRMANGNSSIAPGCINKRIGQNCTISNILTKLLNCYEKPSGHYIIAGRPVVVTVGLWILSIDAISTKNMDYGIDFFLRQSWLDPQLANPYKKKLTLTSTYIENIWTPDTYIQNSKMTNFHFLTSRNRILMLNSNGTVTFFSRISARAFCPMDLTYFPVDSQRCVLHFESYGYESDLIKYEWEEKLQELAFDNKIMRLPQYDLKEFNATHEEVKYFTGTRSRITLAFIMERQYAYFLLNMYIPCAIIVMLSWITLFIPRETVAARIGLSITSFLVMVKLMNILNKFLPKVTYLKLVDWYMIGAFCFITGVLTEYLTILFINKRQRKNEEAQKNCLEKTNRPSAGEYISKSSTLTQGKSTFTSRFYGCQNEETSYFDRPDGETLSVNEPMIYKPPVVELLEGIDSMKIRRETSYQSRSNILDRICERLDPRAIDNFSRFLFPSAFFCFNTVYWSIFSMVMHDRSHHRDDILEAWEVS